MRSALRSLPPRPPYDSSRRLHPTTGKDRAPCQLAGTWPDPTAPANLSQATRSEVSDQVRGSHAQDLGENDDRRQSGLTIARLEAIDRGGVEASSRSELLAAQPDVLAGDREVGAGGGEGERDRLGVRRLEGLGHPLHRRIWGLL